MANIELAYSDDTDLPEVDVAILKALTRGGRQLCVELTYAADEAELGGTTNRRVIAQDVLLLGFEERTGFVRARDWDDEIGGGRGPVQTIDIRDIHKIKVY